ncbi:MULTISPECIES: SsrA-binding protein SmpB [unclassified Streptomyces]|uniref:SsrA-binding protein SmpB n=2 Tax=Streptomyces TaxID=1883 RepID=UPI002E143E55|nr:SsrA-binding protein SmpB [Streptomyces sp. NBC_01334]
MSKGMYVPKESQPKQGGAAASGKVKDGKRKIVAQNKKARHDYAIIDVYEAGLVLTGTEVKSLREGRASLTDAFVQIEGNEAWLHAAHIPEYFQGSWTNHSARRKRKLLLHREEIDKLAVKSEETGHTIVALAVYFKDGRAKAEIALARGKKEYDKRQTLREQQDRRETDRVIAAEKRRQRHA